MNLLSRMVLVLTLFPAVASQGCMNDYKTNASAVAKARTLVDELLEAPVIEPWPERMERLQKQVDNGGNYETESDLATAMVHVGLAKKALPIFEKIEQGHPGRYQTASNLGTAYELAGDPVKALEWIRKGIERNADSHEGSEWLHVRILEAKVAHLAEPKWRLEGSVLGLDFGDGKVLQVPSELPKGNRGEPLTLEAVQAGLRHQLHERLQFVKAPDAMVASLLVDFGDTVALTNHNIGAAAEVYKLALEYAGDPEQGGLSFHVFKRWQVAKAANRMRKGIWDLATDWEYVAVEVAIAAAIAAHLLWRRKMRRQAAIGR